MPVSINSSIARGSFSPNTAPQLTIVIVTWNVRDLLCECLDSLHRDGVPAWADTVVVDNCSTDGTADAVRNRFPWVRYLAMEENLGFSRGNNHVLRSCASEFVLLLNPDTVVHPGAIRALVDHAITNGGTGAVGPRQISRDGSVQYDGAVALPTLWNVACEWLMLNKIFQGSRWFDRRKLGHWDHMDVRPVPAIPGSAMLLRTDALRRVGLLDESMFIIEDMDLCRRLREAGWRIDYLGTHSILHYGGESLRHKGGGFKCQVAYQSFWLYLCKHDGWLKAGMLSCFIWMWSVSVLAIIGLVSLSKGGKTPQNLMRFKEWAGALLLWSTANKWKFRHQLATPPGRPA